MPYASDNDPYCYPGSRTLINTFEISDEAELEEAENEITFAVIASLEEHPVPGFFDLEHLCAIHAEIFSQIYPTWAGQLRTVDIAKGNTRFANCEFIEPAANQLFAELHAENMLLNLAADQYIQRLAHYYSEINVLHPFHEGNGRTQRAFFTLLALKADKRIAWDLLDAEANKAASILAYQTGDEGGLVEILAPLVL